MTFDNRMTKPEIAIKTMRRLYSITTDGGEVTELVADYPHDFLGKDFQDNTLGGVTITTDGCGPTMWQGWEDVPALIKVLQAAYDDYKIITTKDQA